VLKLSKIFAAHKALWQLQSEVGRLRRENDSLRAQNDSMRAGMRRCVTCEYRVDYKQRQGCEAPVTLQPREPAGDE
jgi:hypothetical protein